MWQIYAGTITRHIDTRQVVRFSFHPCVAHKTVAVLPEITVPLTAFLTNDVMGQIRTHGHPAMEAKWAAYVMQVAPEQRAQRPRIVVIQATRMVLVDGR
jgi:hypothetical protein